MSLRVVVVLAFAIAIGGCASANVSSGVDADGTGSEDAAVDAIDAMTCARAPCDILTQCGCETVAEPVCDLDFNQLTIGATRCRASTQNGIETTLCTQTTTCGPLHVCVGGRCRKYCDDDDDCAGPGGLCLIDLTYGTPPMSIPNAPETCTTDCNPVAATNATCPTGWACHIYLDDPTPGTAGDETFLTDCDAPGNMGVGATCTGNRSCNAGLDCVTLSTGGSVCRPTCVCPDGNCGAGSCTAFPNSGTCRAYTVPPVIGGVTYGVCL